MAMRRWARIRIDLSNLYLCVEELRPMLRKNMMEYCIHGSGLDPTRTMIVKQESVGFFMVDWTFQEIDLPSAART